MNMQTPTTGKPIGSQTKIIAKKIGWNFATPAEFLYLKRYF